MSFRLRRIPGATYTLWVCCLCLLSCADAHRPADGQPIMMICPTPASGLSNTPEGASDSPARIVGTTHTQVRAIEHPCRVSDSPPRVSLMHPALERHPVPCPVWAGHMETRPALPCQAPTGRDELRHAWSAKAESHTPYSLRRALLMVAAAACRQGTSP